MDSTYPFQTDAQWYNWGRSFSQQITTQGVSLGLPAALTTQVQSSYATFASAYLRATDPETRSRPNVQAKNDSLKSFLEAARQAVGIIQANAAVSNETRAQLGLKVRKTPPTPVPAPTLAPMLEVVATGPQSARLSIRNAASPDRRRKPTGARLVQVRYTFGDAPAGDPTAWPAQDLTGKTTLDFYWKDMTQTTTVWFVATWVNPRGQQSPVSVPVNVRLLGSGLLPKPQTASDDLKIAA